MRAETSEVPQHLAGLKVAHFTLDQKSSKTIAIQKTQTCPLQSAATSAATSSSTGSTSTASATSVFHPLAAASSVASDPSWNSFPSLTYLEACTIAWQWLGSQDLGSLSEPQRLRLTKSLSAFASVLDTPHPFQPHLANITTDALAALALHTEEVRV